MVVSVTVPADDEGTGASDEVIVVSVDEVVTSGEDEVDEVVGIEVVAVEVGVVEVVVVDDESVRLVGDVVVTDADVVVVVVTSVVVVEDELRAVVLVTGPWEVLDGAETGGTLWA